VEIKTPTGEWKTKMIGRGNTPQVNSMFPVGWNEARIQAEIDSAWINRKPDPLNKNKWIGESASGVDITGYLEPRITAFPTYKGVKK
jgi:hypothetical protein